MPGGSERAALARGLEALGAELPGGVTEALLAYLALLRRWNRTYNLTAVTDPAAMVATHVLDSLSVRPHLHGVHVLDLGTGPGLPGMVLALACPERQFVLLDANAKKVRFCRHAQGALRVGNVTVVRERAERFRPPRRFDTVVARGFGSLRAIAAAAGPLCAPAGRVLAMKGRYPNAELEELGSMRDNAEVVRVTVPGMEAERHVVVLRLSAPPVAVDPGVPGPSEPAR